MYLEEKIEEILDKSSKNTGLEFELIKVEHGIVEVRLLVKPKACDVCVLPAQPMEKILLNMIQRDLPIIREVKIYRTTKGGD